MIQNSLIAGTDPLDAIEEFQAIVDDIPSIVFRTPMSSENGGAETAFISNDVERSLGYPKTTIDNLENWWYENVHPDDLSLANAQFSRWQQTGFKGLLRRQYRFKHQTEGYLWVEDLIRKHSSSTHHADQFVGTITVIDDLVKTRDALQRAQQVGRVGHWQANLRTGELHRSGMVRELLGLERTNSNTSIERFNSLVHPDDREDVKLLERLTPENNKLQIQHRMQHADGHYIWVEEFAELQNDGYTLIGTFRDITEQKALEFELLQRSYTDEMTGIYNRGYFTAQVDKELSRTKRSEQPLSLIILDIDHFKNCNDSYGHPFGDEVITKVAALLKAGVRCHDTAARIGGEEFAVLLPETNEIEAAAVAEKLRKTISAHKFSKNGDDIFVTVTLGVAEFQAGDNWTILFKRADKALYKGKQSGRNQVYPATAL